MTGEMENLFYELKQYLVQHSPKWNTLCDIEQYIIDLQHQLEEKNKAIEDYKNWLNNTIDTLNLNKNSSDTYLICLKTYKNCLENLNKIEGGNNGL